MERFGADSRIAHSAVGVSRLGGSEQGREKPDMTLEKTFTDLDAKFKYPAGMTVAEKAEWDKYYQPRNKKFLGDNPKGKDLVRWRYNRYLHDYLGCIKAVEEGVGKVLDYLDKEGLSENSIVRLGRHQAAGERRDGKDEAWELKHLRKTCATYYDRPRPRVVGRDPRPLGRRHHLLALRPPRPVGVPGDHDAPAAVGFSVAREGVRWGVPMLPATIGRCRIEEGEVTDSQCARRRRTVG